MVFGVIAEAYQPALLQESVKGIILEHIMMSEMLNNVVHDQTEENRPDGKAHIQQGNDCQRVDDTGENRGTKSGSKVEARPTVVKLVENPANPAAMTPNMEDEGKKIRENEAQCIFNDPVGKNGTSTAMDSDELGGKKPRK